jgi:hypothetical protein
MTILTAKERGDVAEQLLPKAANLVMLVHGDGGPRDIHQALVRLTPGQKEALLVILAGLVDPEKPMGEALSWLDFDECGNLTVPDWENSTRIRDLAPEPELSDPDEYVDDIAVDQYLDGKPVTLTNPERLEAVVRAARRGMSYKDLDRIHGLCSNDTATFMSRQRKAYKKAGKPFPDIDNNHGNRLNEEQVVAIREAGAAGGTDREIGLQYGVSASIVGYVCRGERYREYGGPIRAPKPPQPSLSSRIGFNGGQAGFLKNAS